MKKLLVILSVIFIFLCGIIKTNAANSSCPVTIAASIEAVNTTECQTSTLNTDKYFISNNISNSSEFITNNENFGSADNNSFNINHLFILFKKNLKKYNNTDGYLLSISSAPRAP